MKMMNQRVHALSVCAFLMIILLVSGCGESRKKAPDFTLSDLSGNEISLSDFKGKVVLVDFWATWCPACLYAIPELVKLHNEYGEQGLVILAVSLDDPAKADNGFLKAFKEKHRMDFTVLRGDQHVLKDYFENGRVGLPTTFIIDRDGTFADKHTGYTPRALENSVKKTI